VIEAEFIESNTENWVDAKIIGINKKTVLRYPDIYVGIEAFPSFKFLLEIYTQEECVCFKSIRVITDNVIIGFGEYVHFFNVRTEKVNSFKLDSYFGHLYIVEDLEYEGENFGVLVASAEYLHRFTPSGREIWKSNRLGIDGVTVSKISYPNIEASGEWDPPEGWVDVKINIESGANAI
jgi:hypothetical protein